MKPKQALILVGHGSHLSPDSSAPVYAHAERIRASGCFDEVLEAFWKEEPSLRHALNLVASEEVFVVPLFLAEGYFTRGVVPRELGLGEVESAGGGRRVHYCQAVGAHRSMERMILARALETCSLSPAERRDAALVLIGHGTDRSPTSGDTVYSLVEALRTGGEFGRVECGFLDEEPQIGDVVEAIDLPSLVLVPFFVADGWHTRSTIPADLGLTGPLTERDGRTLWYTPPVGTLPEMAETILDVARGAGARIPIAATLPDG
jgi:sirohydrochlorin cobaltochelatase